MTLSKVWAIFVAFILSGCGALIDDSTPEQALRDEGYTKPSCTTSHWLMPHFYGCGDDDDTAWECSAVNNNGKKVNLTVCSNYLFKGSTIRH
jgi:hypothetical protein